MSGFDYALGILLFVVIIGLLITLHELGHLLTAKMFNVYCQDFSIGFGPKIVRYRKKGHETYFNLGIIPLGGYVSMYGEGVELENGLVVPNERSIDGIKKWKRAIVFSAGVVVNFILGFVLIFISYSCFPQHALSQYGDSTKTSIISYGEVTSGSLVESKGISTDDGVVMFPYTQVTGDSSVSGYIIDDDAMFYSSSAGEGSNVVLCYYPDRTTSAPNFIDCMQIYKVSEENPSDELISFGINKLPDFTKVAYRFAGDTSADNTLPLITSESHISFSLLIRKATGTIQENNIFPKLEDETNTILLSSNIKVSSENKLYFEDVGLNFEVFSYWLSAGEMFSRSWDYYVYSLTAIAKGIIGIFTGGISNLGGFITITSQITEINALYGFGTYILYGGMLSVNLALFNLLPFPGLDGWALLVTAIEGITRKKIPTKVKNIVSTIGFLLLIGLMIAVTIMDVLRTAGIM